MQHQDRTVRRSSALAGRGEVPARISPSLTRSLSRNRYAALVLAQSWHASGIVSPGLAASCSSNERNRFPSRASLNSQPASSRSTHAFDSFASATTRRCRSRTGLLDMQLRVEVAHGRYVSHILEIGTREFNSILTQRRKFGVIERLAGRLPSDS